MNIKKKIIFSGFTLIELLFIIAIIGVIAAASMSIVKQRAQETKVEKTALQIQQFVQAGIAYYMDNSCWPVKGGTPTGCAVTKPPSFDGYIPVNGSTDKTTNPFGKQYSWGTLNNMFWIKTDATTVPIAKRIAGMLPQTVTQGSPPDCSISGSCVYTQTDVPGSVGVNQLVFIAARGYLTFSEDDFSQSAFKPGWYDSVLKSTSEFNNCPANYFSSITMLPSSTYEVHNYNYGEDPSPPFSLSMYSVANGPISSGTYATSHFDVSLSTRAVSCKPHYLSAKIYYEMECDVVKLMKNIQISYVIYCCSNKANVCPG